MTYSRLTNEQIEFYRREGYLRYDQPVLPPAKFAALQAHFEQKLARLPADVKVEDIPLQGELTAQQKADKKLSVEVFPKVEVIEGTDSHGLPETTVKVEDGAKALRRVAFVREKRQVHERRVAREDGHERMRG